VHPTRVRLASRSPWQRVTKRRFAIWKLEKPTFTGYVTRLDLLEVALPLWVQSCGERICVADAGYSWLHHFPSNTHYTLTSQWNDKGQLVQWYFDICDHHGVTSEGVPYWDDLYLDVIGLPNNVFAIIDQDELAQASKENHITQQHYDLAHYEANHLLQELEQRNFELLEVARQHYKELVIARQRCNSYNVDDTQAQR
jgi:uncharacterized protein